jgi:hypothetical protein
MLARIIVYNLVRHFSLVLAMNDPKYPTLFH